MTVEQKSDQSSSSISSPYDGAKNDFIESSPGVIQPDRWRRHTEEKLKELFPGDPLLCIEYQHYYPKNGEQAVRRVSDTKSVGEWSGEGDLWKNEFIVPAKMTSRTGKTKKGKESHRSSDNVGPREYLVVEFDKDKSGNPMSQDEQAFHFMTLARYAPLVMAVFSGGKSLHGWFKCGEVPQPLQDKFIALAVSLGADESIFRDKVKMVRLPDGTRFENGARQTIIFWNPFALKGQDAGRYRGTWATPEEFPQVTNNTLLTTTSNPSATSVPSVPSNTSDTCNTSVNPLEFPFVPLNCLFKDEDGLISYTLPTAEHTSCKKIFEFAQGLISLGRMRGSAYTHKEHKAAFRKWHAMALPFLREDRTYEDYEDEFLSAVYYAKFPLGLNPIPKAWELAGAQPLPNEALQFEDKERQRLVAFLFHLQQLAGPGVPFFVSCYQLAALFAGTPDLRKFSHSTTNKMLNALVMRGFLKIVEKGNATRATRYLFIAQQQALAA